MRSNGRQRFVLCPGEPAGIGPDLLIELFRRGQTADLLVLADPDMLLARSRLLGVGLNVAVLTPDEPLPGPGRLAILPIPLGTPARPGEPDPNHAAGLLQALDTACALCLAGQAQGLITGPLHKAAINQAGIAFTGHTEYLARRCQAVQPVMLLACPGLRVALVTTHLSLREVPDHITAERLARVLRTIWQDCGRYFALAGPAIAVCGLNPHAGEQGCLGVEEETVIQPVLDSLAAQGMAMSGPYPADTAFTEDMRRRFDVFVCMYHDQGLPVLKALGFHQAVNVTLGLPIIRTSVDHGTALSLAGSGRADPASLAAAVRMARDMAGIRGNASP